MHPYNDTITWLKFRLDLQKAPPSFWIDLGDCAAALRHLTGVPLPIADARTMERSLLVTSMQARLAMDGIPLAEYEVAGHLGMSSNQGAGPAPGSREVEALWGTWQGIRKETGKMETSLSPGDLQVLHSRLVSRTPEEDRPGAWRKQPKGIHYHDGVPPELIGLFMEELCDWLNAPELHAPVLGEALPYTILRMLIAELYLTWIQPFPTAHARLAGSMAQMLLAQAGAGPVAGHLASIHFHRNSQEHQRQVALAAEGNADPIPFLTFGLHGIADGLRDLHARVRALQLNSQWRAQLLDLFSGAEDGPTRRQRRILLDLGEVDAPVPMNALPDLSTSLAKLYAGVSEKTLRRDVDVLTSIGVLRKTQEGLRVERGNLLAFNY